MPTFEELMAAGATAAPDVPASAGAQAKPVGQSYEDLMKAGATAPQPQPPQADPGFFESMGREFANTAGSFGAGPAVEAGLSTGISKIPGLRSLVAALPGVDSSITNPNLTYSQRREAAAGSLEAAREDHPVATTIGGLAGSTVSALAVPEAEALQAMAPAAKGAIMGAGLGGVASAGETLNQGGSLGDVAENAAKGAAFGAGTGATFEGLAGKYAAKAPENAESWIVKDIVGHDRGTQPASATIKKRLSDDGVDVRRLVNDSPDLKSAIDKAAGGNIDALKNLQGTVAGMTTTELEPRLGRYSVVDSAADHGGVRVGDLVDHVAEAARGQDVGNANVEKSLEFWRDRIKDKWGAKEIPAETTYTLDPKKEIAPGFTLGEAMKNYQGAAEKATTPEGRAQAQSAIDTLNKEFGIAKTTPGKTVYDPDAVIPTSKLRALVTDLQNDTANAMGGLDEKTRYQKLKEVQKPVWDFLNEHLDTVAKKSPDAAAAVDQIRASNNKLSALLNIQKVVDSRVNRAGSNANAGMRPAFGVRGAIHQITGGGVPGVVMAGVMGHPAVAAGLAMTTVAPGIKRSADKAMAALIKRAASGSVPASLIEHAITQGVPRALAARVAASSTHGIINDLTNTVTQ